MILRAQIFISAVIRTTDSTQSMRETRYAEPEVVFRRGSLFFYSTFVAQLVKIINKNRQGVS